MGVKFPLIRMQYGWLIDSFFTAQYKVKWPEWTQLSRDEVLSIIETFKTDWIKEENQILTGIYSITGLEYFQNAIDVYIVSATTLATSEPLIIGCNWPDKFNDTLTHELIHRLLTDNTTKFNLGALVKTMFPDIEDRTTRNHVLVHAIHTAVYLDILKDKARLERDITVTSKNPSYKESWRIVNERGYKELIAEFKKQI